MGGDDEQGSKIFLLLKEEYVEDFSLTITHWSGNDRTIGGTVVYFDYSDMIIDTDWSD